MADIRIGQMAEVLLPAIVSSWRWMWRLANRCMPSKSLAGSQMGRGAGLIGDPFTVGHNRGFIVVKM